MTNEILHKKKDLEKALKESDIDLKVYEVPHLSDAEKRRIQLDAIKRARTRPRDGK